MKPTPSSSRVQTRRISSISTRVFDDVSGMGSQLDVVPKEIRVVVASIGHFGPATNSFLESPVTNEIAGFYSAKCMSKNKGWLS